MFVHQSQLYKINQMDPEILSKIKPGGWWEPSKCLSKHSVAIIIPYKDRWHHLTTLLNFLHPLLQRQEIRYKLYVVEQVLFLNENRGGGGGRVTRLVFKKILHVFTVR